MEADEEPLEVEEPLEADEEPLEVEEPLEPTPPPKRARKGGAVVPIADAVAGGWQAGEVEKYGQYASFVSDDMREGKCAKCGGWFTLRAPGKLARMKVD